MEQLYFICVVAFWDCQAAVGAAQNLCVSIIAAIHDLLPEDKKPFWVILSTEIQIVLYSVKVVLLPSLPCVQTLCRSILINL